MRSVEREETVPMARMAVQAFETAAAAPATSARSGDGKPKPAAKPKAAPAEVTKTQESRSKVPSKSATAKKQPVTEAAPQAADPPPAPQAAPQTAPQDPEMVPAAASPVAEDAASAPAAAAVVDAPEPAGQPAAAPADAAPLAAAAVAAAPTPPVAAEAAREPVREPAPMAQKPVVPPQPGVPRPQGGIPNRAAPPPRPMAKAEQFAEGDYVVYPTHGVGKVERIATEEIAGHKLELIHITFEENRMTLRVPVAKARTAGLRKLASRKLFDDAMAVLKGRARIKRTMWSRRAQEYEAKINSGDPLAIAEVVRDLHRNAGQPDQSFSERQIYEAAMDRLAAELAALERIDKAAASVKLVEFLKTV